MYIYIPSALADLPPLPPYPPLPSLPDSCLLPALTATTQYKVDIACLATGQHAKGIHRAVKHMTGSRRPSGARGIPFSSFTGRHPTFPKTYLGPLSPSFAQLGGLERECV